MQMKLMMVRACTENNENFLYQRIFPYFLYFSYQKFLPLQSIRADVLFSSGIRVEPVFKKYNDALSDAAKVKPRHTSATT